VNQIRAEIRYKLAKMIHRRTHLDDFALDQREMMSVAAEFDGKGCPEVSESSPARRSRRLDEIPQGGDGAIGRTRKVRRSLPRAPDRKVELGRPFARKRDSRDEDIVVPGIENVVGGRRKRGYVQMKPRRKRDQG
jgi:hypothetical protein